MMSNVTSIEPKPATDAPADTPVSVTFEFFPPGTPRAEETLWQCIQRLAPIGPRFVSVTYGAGGSTRERTHNTVRRILEETDLTPAAHLTCVSASREEVLDVVRQYKETGVRHIVALRGDAPEGEQAGGLRGDGFADALELVGGIRSVGDFDISVAAYPETHPDAKSPQDELDYLKRKIDAGASRAITQFFFDNDVYLRFVDRARDAGITVPIVPGILPVTNFARVKEFAARCNTSIPARFAALFEGLDEDPETRKLVAATVAAEQCQALQAEGVNDFHFYTLNRAELTRSLCHILGLRASDLPDHEVRKAS